MTRFATACLPVLLLAAPAAAQDLPLPDAARAMIEAAIVGGDASAVEAVTAAARTAFPANAAEIDTLLADYRARTAELAARQAAARQAEIRQAGLFDNWSGEGQIGGFQSSGNSNEIGVSAALALQRQGIDWEHRLRLSADYRRSDGDTSREQLLARYEPRYTVSERMFAYGLAQYERDRLQGYSGRYSLSGGLGYRVIDSDAAELNVQAGPAYRVTRRFDGTSASRLAALAGVDFKWQVSPAIKLTQDANSTVETGGEALLVVDGSNTTLNATTGLEAAISDRLSARASWNIKYDSNPPASAVSTDTLTRFTLVYGF
ncbi:DUF481 domain-containing protein [Aurantiacibacter luteus]|uniref:Membrane protein n=1 Tax=Aurantiacibacter luteus TaxID=1581420 RepID=A0A0G9MXY6_9SPHN|nr:DUF481 domain-containing protein [Aurantiacibacter luteus]KLE35611.1 membrane protein [Aurantiacibacter luteus]